MTRASARRLAGVIAYLSVVTGPAWAAAADGIVYDIVIRGGTIVDGSGMDGYRGDVAIAGGHVLAVGKIDPGRAARTIDATGLIVAPGFINIHSHAEAEGVSTAVNMLTQGVTTEIINADGFGSTDLPGQFATFSAGGLAENIGGYIGFNAIWRDAMGDRDLRPSEGQIASMRAALETNLAAGAWGVSSGLDYRPGYYATREEVIRVVSAAAGWRTNFPNHDRVKPEENFSSFKGMEETVDIGGKAGLVPVITHIKSAGPERGRAPQVLAMVEAARARGIWTAIDLYPYLAGQTALQAFMVPGWAADGGRDAMLARFRDPALRPQLVKAAERAVNERMAGPAGIALPALGRKLSDIMATEQVGAGEAVLRTLERDPYISAIMTFGVEEDVVAFLRYPDTAVACDCGATVSNRGHPRYYGSFPKILGHYVRDTGVITMSDAVRKMTALPAAIIGMVDRGRLAPGMRADLTLFDPDGVRDHATFDAPVAPSEGIRHVIVNGVAVLADGVPTGARPGAILLRDRHMPSRPMTLAATGRAMTATADSAGYAVAIAVEQRAGERHAAGKVTLTDRKAGTVWRADRFGVLQAMGGWASLTATVKDAAGHVRPITLTLDHVDGEAGGGAGPPVVSLAFGDGAPVTLAAKGAVRID